MLKVVIENIERLYDYLLFPTESATNISNTTSVRLIYSLLPAPLQYIDIKILSTGEELELSALIASCKGTFENATTKKVYTGNIPISLPLNAEIPGLEIIFINPRQFIVKKGGKEKFYVYANKIFGTEYAGAPIIISAGLTKFPSGPTIKLESIEQLQEDLEIFGRIIEKIIENVYNRNLLMCVAELKELKNKLENNQDDEDLKNLIANRKSMVDHYSTILDTNHKIYLRAPLSSDKSFDDDEGGGEDENRNNYSNNGVDTGTKQDQYIQSIHRLTKPEDIEFGLDDVAGIEAEKEQVMEIVRFLKDPEKFNKLGAKIPKGAMIEGPPGTGKTMLAKAIAKESNVPFFTMNGSEFIEVFVGVGAGRVRKLFKAAKKKAPCILFIDEIDAVGGKRTGSSGGGSEHDQTLNQLLAEMDGFNPKDDVVIVIAATNRPDILDPALLRPGRFDRRVIIPMPDLEARGLILLSHAKHKLFTDEIDFKKIARRTAGFSGADLENLLNEAALLAVKRDKNAIEEQDIHDAKEKITMGPERKLRNIPKEELITTAYHEAGHAILSEVGRPHTDPIHKVTIIPRGNALGLTIPIPEEDRYSQTKAQLIAQIRMLMAGRAAEEILAGNKKDITTGAAEDIQRATQIARKMVMDWGLSEEIGPIYLGSDTSHNYLGYRIANGNTVSEGTLSLAEEEIKNLVGKALNRAREILTKHKTALDALANALLQNETLEGDEIRKIITECSPWVDLTLKKDKG